MQLGKSVGLYEEVIHVPNREQVGHAYELGSHCFRICSEAEKPPLMNKPEDSQAGDCSSYFRSRTSMRMSSRKAECPHPAYPGEK